MRIVLRSSELVLLLALFVAGACGDDDATAGTMRDASVDDVGVLDDARTDAEDASPPMDAGGVADDAAADSGDPPTLDAGGDDATVDSGSDATTTDAAGLDAGGDVVGVISGTCGELDDAELSSSSAFVFSNAIDLRVGFGESDPSLSEGAMEILADGTAGGSSGLSEALAFELLHRCEGASLVKSETEIVYDPPDSNKTDILVSIDGHLVGVSVTRAVAFPFDSPYPVEQARTLVERKLMGILESTMNVVAEDAWVKQILHVIAYSAMHAASVLEAWDLIDVGLRADTILYVTVTDGDDAAVY